MIDECISFIKKDEQKFELITIRHGNCMNQVTKYRKKGQKIGHNQLIRYAKMLVSAVNNYLRPNIQPSSPQLMLPWQVAYFHHKNQQPKLK